MTSQFRLSTRSRLRRFATVSALALLVFGGCALLALAWPVGAVTPPCTPQAPNLATRDACHTQTARASGATSTATRPATVTRIAPTPTRFPTGTQTPHPVSVVLAGVVYPLDIDRDCVRKAGHLECLIAIWVVVEQP